MHCLSDCGAARDQLPGLEVRVQDVTRTIAVVWPTVAGAVARALRAEEAAKVTSR